MDGRNQRILGGALLALAFAFPTQFAMPAEQTDSSQAAKKPVRRDRYGSPLPEGAIARLGTVRLRHSGEVWSLIYSADGKFLIAGGTNNHKNDQTAIRVWDARTGQLIRSFGREYGVGSLALSPDGKKLATESGASSISIWDLEKGEMLHDEKWTQDGNVISVAFSPDGKTLACIGGGKIEIWDANMALRLHLIEDSRGGCAITFSPDGKMLASISDDGLCVWDVETRKELWNNPAKAGGCHCLAYSSNGKLLAVGSHDGAVHILAAETGKVIRACRGHTDEVNAVAWANDNKTLISGGRDESVRVWDADNGKQLHCLKGHLGAVYTIGVSPDGETIASGSFDHTIRLWNLASGKELLPGDGHHRFVDAIAYAPDGKTLASGGFDNMLQLWDPSTSKVIRTFPPHQEPIKSIAFSRDGTRLVSAGWDWALHLDDVDSGKQTRVIKGHNHLIYCVTFSPDDKTLASASIDSSIRIWKVETGEELRRMEGGEVWKWVKAIAFSPDGKTLASGREDKTIRLCRVDTGKEIRQFLGHKDEVTSVAFSPDGKTLATGSWDETIRLWDVESGKCLRKFAGHTSKVTSVAFSPDGRTIVSASEDETIALWEVASGERVRQFRGHDDEVSCVSYCPDGRKVASGSRDFTILIWDVTGVEPDGRPVVRELTNDESANHWKELATANATTAFQAMWTLIASPKTSVAYLKSKLKPVDADVTQQIPRWIRELDDERFAVREKATTELEMLGELAVPALRQTLKDRPSPEVAQRIRDLLDKADAPVPSVRRLREIRSVAALEHIDNPEARKVLQEVAKGLADARLTQEAKASLDRLSKRKASLP
jgi:WD40 repeat protein